MDEDTPYRQYLEVFTLLGLIIPREFIEQPYRIFTSKLKDSKQKLSILNRLHRIGFKSTTSSVQQP